MKKQDIERWKTISDKPPITFSQSQIENIIHQTKQKQQFKFALSCFLIPLCIFTLLVNTSQTFVSAINGVPILTSLTKLLEHNPSIYLARNDEIYQKIDQTYENDDFKLYIESMVADESQLVLFYQVSVKNETFQTNSNIHISPNQLTCLHSDETLIENELSYTVYYFTETQPFKEEQLSFEAYLRKWEGTEDKISKSIPIELKNDLSKTYQGKEIEINQTLILDEQEIDVTQLIIYPLRTIIKTKENPKNTKNILNYNFYLQLNNQQIKGIQNGVFAYYDNETMTSTVLESPYLLDQEFDLVLESIQWVNKNEEELIYDIQTQTIENLPANMHYTVQNNTLLFQIDGHTDPDEFLDFYIINQENKNLRLYATSYQEKANERVTFALTIQEENIQDGKVVIHNGVGEIKEINQRLKQ